MSVPQPPHASQDERWTIFERGYRGESISEALRDVLDDADLSIEVQLWTQPLDPFAAGFPWWQWRTPCDCPDTSFGRNPHRWDCDLTPIWAQLADELESTELPISPWPNEYFETNSSPYTLSSLMVIHCWRCRTTHPLGSCFR